MGERLKYYVSGTKRNPGSKDITAFYGLNRTAKINDFQLSDMMNLDCEFFPYVGTRRSREEITLTETVVEKVPGVDEEGNEIEVENEVPREFFMRVICSDSDVNTEDYAVTGIAEDGSFVYRGEKFRRTISENIKDSVGAKAGNDMELMGSGDRQIYMTECFGDYVVFPNMDVFTPAGEAVEKKTLMSSGGGYETDMENLSPTYYENVISVSCNDEGKGSIVVRRGNRRRRSCGDIVLEFLELMKSGKLYPGVNMILSMYRHQITDHYVEIADDVYENVESIRFVKPGTDDELLDGDKKPFTAENILYTDERVPFDIEIAFEAKTQAGEVVDISERFKYAAHPYSDPDSLDDEDTFYVGSFDTIGFGGREAVYSNLEISFIGNVMSMGEPFGGRLFAADNQGLTVYYSSAVDPYDFTLSGVTGEAGFLSCTDPGKWTAMCVYRDSLYVFKRNFMYRIYSGDGLTFFMDKVADVGALSATSVAVVDDVMYFLSGDGIYRFTGAYPQLLPDSLKRKYVGGAIGGDDGKVFFSVQDPSGAWELCVWHADKEIFSRHDDFEAKQFLYAYGKVFALSGNGVVHQMEEGREVVEFSLSTKKYFFGFSKKAANAARIYFDLSGDDSYTTPYIQLSVSYDGGVSFEPCGGKITDGKVRYVPVRFRKCDEVILKIEGKGVFDLKGISFSVYQGGDIKQNHMIKW